MCRILCFYFFLFVGYSKVVSSGLYGGIAAAPAAYGHGLGILLFPFRTKNIKFFRLTSNII